MMTRDRGVSLDPVCGKPVFESGSESAEYKRKTYFFCSRKCRSKFEHQAERIHVGELARMGALFADRKVTWGVA
jgi:YHS domain-containing protein